MDKLWLSSQEKKKYNQYYCKLHDRNYLNKAKLIKFLHVNASISTEKATIIVQKSFKESKDQDQIDQAGFFYLMKYTAFLQNGGSADEDITQIQKELPITAIKTKKNGDSSEHSEKSSSHSKKKQSNPSDIQQSNGDGEEERKQSNGLHKKELSESLKSNEEKRSNQELADEQENASFINSSFLQTTNTFVQQSDLEMLVKSEINYEQSEFSHIQPQDDAQIAEKQIEQQRKASQGKPEVEEEEEEEEQKQIIKDQQYSVLMIDEMQSNHYQPQQKLSQSDALNSNVVVLEAEQKEAVNKEYQKAELPDFSQPKNRCMTFGKTELQELQKIIQEDKEMQEKVLEDEAEQLESRIKSINVEKKPEVDMRICPTFGQGVQQVVDDYDQQQNQNNINNENKDAQNKGKPSSLQSNQSFLQESDQYNSNFTLGQGVPINNVQIQETNKINRLNSYKQENQGINQINIFGTNPPQQEQQNNFFTLGQGIQNGTEDSIYEHQMQLNQMPKQNISFQNGNNKNTFEMKREESFLVSNLNSEEPIQSQIESEEEEEQQLIKSVSKVFQKDDQNQIKNAFDFFKSNREESGFSKSRIRKEKQQKKVKILGYRNVQENILKKYTLYQIETTYEGKKNHVDRRYNNFRALHDYFENSVDYYGIIKPTIPSKNMTSLGSYLGSNFVNQQTLEQRKIDLEHYLNLYLQNDILKNDKVLTRFLEEEEFIPPSETQFSYIDWAKKMVNNVQITDFSELKEYTEAKMKITLNEFFKMGDNEIDTVDIDSKMVIVNELGSQVTKVIDFLNEDIKADNDAIIAVEGLEKNFYTEYDKRDSYMESQKESLYETLKRFKSETLDLSQDMRNDVQEKVNVLQEFRILNNSIESAKVAQQVLKNKIQERFILKNMKLSKFNKVHEHNSNKSDSSEAKRELEKLNEKFQQSENIIKHIQDKLSKELATFIEIQKQRISDLLGLFVDMHQKSLQRQIEERLHNK